MIKLAAIAVLTLVLTASAGFAQSSPGAGDAANLEIISFEWKPYFSGSRKPALPSFPHSDYTSPTEPPTPEYREYYNTGVYYRESGRFGKIRNPPPAPPAGFHYDIKKTAFSFVLKLKNTGAKEIDSVEAAVVFSDENGIEFLRYNINSEKDIEANDTIKLDRIVRARNESEYSVKLTPEILAKVFKARKDVVISRIVYKDGTEIVPNN